MGCAYNGLGYYQDAYNLLEEAVRKGSKDKLVKMELNKAKKMLDQEKKTTQDQKDTYAKMFNPDKRKEIERKRTEEKKEASQKEASQKGDKSGVESENNNDDNGKLIYSLF